MAVLPSFPTVLEGSIINVALPAPARDLHGGLVTRQWTVDAYLVTVGTLTLLAGSPSDAFGRGAAVGIADRRGVLLIRGTEEPN